MASPKTIKITSQLEAEAFCKAHAYKTAIISEYPSNNAAPWSSSPPNPLIIAFPIATSSYSRGIWRIDILLEGDEGPVTHIEDAQSIAYLMKAFEAEW